MDMNQQLAALAGLGATWVLWLLVGLSVTCLYVIFERAVYLARHREPLARQRKIRELIQQGKFRDLFVLTKDHGSMQSRVVRAALSKPEQGSVAAEKRIASALRSSEQDTSHTLGFLGTVGANAPFVGLLGTVIGIVGAFQELDQSGGRVTSGLMAEVGEALIATAVGLLVALPAVAAFNSFQRLIKRRSARARALGDELLAELSARDCRGV